MTLNGVIPRNIGTKVVSKNELGLNGVIPRHIGTKVVSRNAVKVI